ncbi:NADPH:quinone reductase [Chelativorans sp. YIM 93263]|uniref:NADPH:quinone reductase n=1 Tax=Chelativorans sp. YIM 93263 TaxID=2906648 RepID=UPI0023799348|nr:NADPH:quinone reductase [Chelativorans sp. YIM 93263]
MKAAWYENNGPARKVLNIGEMEPPDPAPGEVRVRLYASGVNPSDVKSRSGRPLSAPRIIPHSDGAGEIEAVGPGVAHSRVGERVWVWNGQWQRPFGTAAEFICLPEDQAVTLPDNVDYATGACFGIPALTAIHAVNLFGPLAGKALLVTGAGSSVGFYAVQFAKAAGARVLGTASRERAALAREAGADFVIDYKTKDIVKVTRDLTGGNGADGIIDMDLSSTIHLVADGALVPHGKVICYGSNVAREIPLPFPAMLWNSITLQFFLVYDLLPDQRMRAIAQLLDTLRQNTLRHHLGERFPLERIADAHEAVESGGVSGNIVLDIS